MLKLLTVKKAFMQCAAGSFLGASIVLAAASCSSASTDSANTEPEATASDYSGLAGADAVARAEEWVAAQLHYCQAANHQKDWDNACSTYCNRTDNPAWDPYRSDCSGLVSWAWGLKAPGRVTQEFAPFQTDITHTITATSLKPGDAVNNSDHVMLFKAWVIPGTRATFIEEPGCATAITHAHEFTSNVTTSGDSIYVSSWGGKFTAIRYDGIGQGGGGSPAGCSPGGLYCGGDEIGGDTSTLYKCNGGLSASVVEHCTHGCAVRPGQDDVCASGSSPGGSCVAGGLYCGGDKLSGDANTLYKCNGGGSVSVVEHCSNGCSVNSGQNDSCKAAPAGGSCVTGGLYCGGDKVGGDSSTLYKCNGPGSVSALGHCSSGCAVVSGSNDECKGGGSCVAGGLYCGGDKVSGDPSTLYKCTGGSSGSVVSHCAKGCAVQSGQNDACK